MKTISIRISYQSIHDQVCNMCAAYDWLQQVNPANGQCYPLITSDMFTLMLAHYRKLKDNALSILRGWVVAHNEDTESSCTISMAVPNHVCKHDVELLLESYLQDATLRKYSHHGTRKSDSNADETLYILASMLTPEEFEEW